MRDRKKSFSKAFTLVEMLVTIMIILLLAGMLLPAINGARKRGRDALCKNNLKQLQVAAMTYAISEGNGKLPHAKSEEYYNNTSKKWIWNKTGWVNWVDYTVDHDAGKSGEPRPGETYWWGSKGFTCITNGTLWKYVKSTKAYACPEWLPSIEGKAAPDSVVLSLSDTNRYPWRCYAINSSVSGDNIGDIEASKRILFAEASSTNFYNGVQISQTNLTQTYSAYESGKTECEGWDGSLNLTPVSGQTYPKENVGLYHNGKANVVFVDGHIETLDWNVTTNAASGNW